MKVAQQPAMAYDKVTPSTASKSAKSGLLLNSPYASATPSWLKYRALPSGCFSRFICRRQLPNGSGRMWSRGLPLPEARYALRFG
jgi:hypothetical protein